MSSTQKSKEAQIKAYQRIQSGYYNGKTIPASVQRQANKGKELLASGITIPTKKAKTLPTQPTQPTQPKPVSVSTSKTLPTQPTQPTQPKPVSVSTSKTQLETIKTTTKALKAYSTNITLNFAKPINVNTFKSRYSYLLRRILSTFKNFTFTNKMQVLIKSKTIMKDTKNRDFEVGNSTGYQYCKNLSQLKTALILQFDLIGATCINSLEFISFIDLTITLYDFP